VVRLSGAGKLGGGRVVQGGGGFSTVLGGSWRGGCLLVWAQRREKGKRAIWRFEEAESGGGGRGVKHYCWKGKGSIQELQQSNLWKRRRRGVFFHREKEALGGGEGVDVTAYGKGKSYRGFKVVRTGGGGAC